MAGNVGGRRANEMPEPSFSLSFTLSQRIWLACGPKSCFRDWLVTCAMRVGELLQQLQAYTNTSGSVFATASGQLPLRACAPRASKQGLASEDGVGARDQTLRVRRVDRLPRDAPGRFGQSRS